MPDAWRAYLEMALGLTEAPRKRAQKVAGELVNRGGATAAQLQGLVDDLLSAGMANREALTNIVRYEVDKALGVVGLATAEAMDALFVYQQGIVEERKQAASASSSESSRPRSRPSRRKGSTSNGTAEPSGARTSHARRSTRRGAPRAQSRPRSSTIAAGRRTGSMPF